MLRPSMSDILKNGESYYSFVVAVAKRARQIACEYDARHELLDDKPVSLAVDEFASGKIRVSDTVEMPEEE